MDAEKLGAFYMVDPRAFSYRVKVLRGSSHTPGGFLQIFGRCFPTYTHIIRFEYEVNRMNSTIFCHECNSCNSLEGHEWWLQKLCRLFSLRCQDQGEIVSFVSFREIDCRSAQTTASQHHSCKTLHFVSSPPQMIYRSVPPTFLVQIQQQMNFLGCCQQISS